MSAHTLECVAALAVDAGSHREAARLFGAAGAIRQRIGQVRFQIHQAGYKASVAALRDAMGDEELESAWAEGTALSTDEAIAYAQRRRGERKRPTGTPTERDVVRLVSEGLANKDIATRLSSHPGPCRAPSPTSTPNSESPRACSSFKNQLATRDERHLAHSTDERIEGHCQSARRVCRLHGHVDAVNTFRCTRRSFRVVSSLRVGKFSVSAGHAVFCSGSIPGSSTENPPVIPEGEGPVKTNLCVVLVRSASFLVLAGRVEVGVGVKCSGGARPRSGGRALTAASFGACCSGRGGRNCLFCFRLG